MTRKVPTVNKNTVVLVNTHIVIFVINFNPQPLMKYGDTVLVIIEFIHNASLVGSFININNGYFVHGFRMTPHFALSFA